MAAGIENRLIFGRRKSDGKLIPFQATFDGGIVADEWEIVTLSDVTANNSNKTIAVPVGYQYQILWAYVSFTSTGTVGARQLAFCINDNAGTQIFLARVGVTQAASLTYLYSFGPSLPDLTTVRDTTSVMTPIPPTLILNPLQQIRIWDNKAIDAAADDMSVYIQVARRAV